MDNATVEITLTCSTQSGVATYTVVIDEQVPALEGTLDENMKGIITQLKQDMFNNFPTLFNETTEADWQLV